MFDLVSYLESKGLPLKFSSTQVHTTCFFCDEDPSRPGRLYINIDNESDKFGLWFCFLCHQKGGINSLRKHFGDPPISDKPSYRQLHILNAATKYYQDRLAENLDAYTYLTVERGLTDETIEQCALGWADGGLLNHLTNAGYGVDEIRETGLVNSHGFDFHQNKITIPYAEFGNTVTIRGKQMDGKYLSLPGSAAMLYGVDSVRGEETVVLTAGEFDCALMQQFGFSALGVPGENIWKPEWTQFLEDAKRVYIVFDNDSAGRAGAEKVAKELGPKARVVEMPKANPGQKKIDITEWVVNHSKTKESFDWLFSKSKGGLLVSVNEAMDRWLEVEGNPDRVGLRFNIREIDSQLNHGLTPGQVVVLVGKTNCLSADTEIIVSRGGDSRHYTLEYVFNMLKGDGVVGVNGRRYIWNKDITTMVQRRCHDGTIRLVELRDIWHSGEKELWEVTTVCGKKIKSTMDHRFMTEDGFKPLKDISVGDRVYVNHAADEPLSFLYQTGLTEITSIEYVGVGDTYDIEVLDNPHNFIANEFVVHNSAKSLSTFNIIHRMRTLKPDLKILLLSLEQTRNEWFERAHRIHNFYEPGATIVDTVHFWENNLFLVDKNRVTETELENCIDQYKYEMGLLPDIVIIDYLGYYARSYQGDEYQRTSSAIMGLKAVAKEYGLVIFVPHQANRQIGFSEQIRLDNMRGSGLVEETSDLVLSIYSTDQTPGIQRHEEKKEVHMRILKSRDGGVNATVTLHFAPLTLALVPPSDPLFERALKEKQYAWAGDTWKQAVQRFQTGDTSLEI